MAEFRARLEPFYYDEKRYGSYLEQLGITYPTVRAKPAAAPGTGGR